MQTFKTKQESFRTLQKKLFFRCTLLTILSAAAGVVISLRNSKSGQYEANSLIIVIAFLFFTLGYGLYRVIMRQKMIFTSYNLIIGYEELSEYQLYSPVITLSFCDITEIEKYPDGSFVIKGKQARDIIHVPEHIKNREELERALQNICPITLKKQLSFIEKHRAFSGLLPIVLMLCMYAYENKVVVGLSGSFLIAFICWSYFITRNNKDIDYKTRKRTNWVWVVMLSVVLVMIFKLTGFTWLTAV